MDLSNQLFSKKDFSGQDLRGVPMQHSKFFCCNFDRANLSGNDCTDSYFTGSTMVDTICRNTNFRNARLNCTFKPADAFGMTITLKCETFRGMVTSAMWWYCWQQFSFLMVPDKDKDGTDPKAPLLAALGTEKFLRLQRLFREREL